MGCFSARPGTSADHRGGNRTESSCPVVIGVPVLSEFLVSDDVLYRLVARNQVLDAGENSAVPVVGLVLGSGADQNPQES